jgi:hypothetical protein
MVSRGVRLALMVALAMAATAGSARAQMGTGWTEYFPMKNIQLRGAGARYTNENGIETFSTQPGDERSEARIVNDHRTGTWQFEGWVNVKAGVNGGCIHQVFKFLMIVVYPNDGGEFRQHSYQRLAATGLYDKWVRVNTIHDPGAGRADVYIDGTWRGMTESKSPGPEGWYHKYGIYNSSGTRPVVQWRNVRFFKDGKGGPTASASDGGPPPAPDAGLDVRPTLLHSIDIVTAPPHIWVEELAAESGETHFEPNMTVMLEPNPITPDGNLGLFVGRTYIITENGHERVTKYPLELVVV